MRRFVSLTVLFGMITLGASHAQALTPQGAVTITSAATGTYGTAYTATASGGNGGGALVWALGTGSTASGAAINASSGVVTANSIGIVRIKVYRAADATYAQSATTADFTVTFAPRPITVTLSGSKVYNGNTTPTGASAAITSGSLAGSDTISYAYSNTPSANVGTYSAAAGGAIAFRSSSQGGDYTGTIVIPKPTGTVQNDVLLALISYDSNSGTTTPPAGWTSLGSTFNYYDGQTAEVFLRVADGTEGASFSFGYTSNSCTGLILCYSGVNPVTPLNVAAARGASDTTISSGGTISAPSVTTTTNGSMLVWLVGLDGDANTTAPTFTAPSGYTQRLTANYSWNYETSAEKLQTTAGATGIASGSAVFPGAAGTFGFTVALAPATGASLVTATVTTPANYAITYAGSYSITNPLVQGVVSVTSPATGTYGTTYTATASGGNGSGAIVWALGSGSTASGAAIDSNTGIVTANSSGIVLIKAYRAADATYAQSATTADFTVTLATRPITVTLSGSKAYNGDTTASGAAAAITAGSLAGSDTISYVFSNTSSANAGSYSGLTTATVSNVSAPTVRTASYAITYAGSYTITSSASQAAVTINSSATPIYGTAYTATATGGSGTGAIVWALGTGSTASGAAINATTGVVTTNSTGIVRIKAYRAGDTNYAQSATTADFTVTFGVRAITVTLAGSKASNGNTTPTGATATITVGSLAGSDTIGYVFGNTSSANAGSYSGLTTATISNVTAPTARTGSYAITYAGYYTITSSTPQAAVTINSAATGTYGTTYTATANGGSGTGALVWALGTGSTASGAAINATSGVVTANSTGIVRINVYRAGDATYAQSATTADFTVTFAPRPITVTLSGSKVYNGNTTPTGASASITSGSLAGSDTISYAYSNTPSANVGTYSAAAGGAIAFRSSSQAGDYTGTIVIPKPAGTVQNDVLLALISYDANNGTTTPPAGWTSLGSTFNYYDDQTSEVFLRVADGTEGASFSFGYTSNSCTGLILCYSGVNPVTPLNVATAYAKNDTAISSGGTISAPSVTTTMNGSMIVWFAGLDGDANTSAPTFTAPSGYTQRLTANYSWNYETSAEKLQTTAGATGVASGSAVFPGAAGTFGFTVALAPTTGASLVTATVTTPANYAIIYAGSYSITTAPAIPVISSPTTASGQVGSAFSYQINATNSPTSFNATGLPAGLSVNTATGLITGTPTTSGTSTVTLSAINAGGTGSATLSLTVSNSSTSIVAINAGGPAVGTFLADTYFTGGTTYGLTPVIDTSGVTNPAPASVYQSERWGNCTYTIPGLTANTVYKVRLHFAEFKFTAANQRQFNVSINGTSVLTNFDIFAAAGGINRAVVREFNATANSSGQISVQFTIGAFDEAKISGIEIVASSISAPVIGSATTTSGQVGSAFSYQITASNSPTGFNATGLPAGLSVNTTTGLITGTPTVSGTSAVTLSATNAGGTGSASLSLTITSASAAVVAINAGGPAVGSFLADTYFTGGNVVVYPGTAVIDTSGVSNPPPADVYQSVRWGNCSYTIPGLTPAANYKVRLHFAELYWTSPNQRQFNVAINGSTVLTNFDIVASAGGMNRAVVREFNTSANGSGQIVIQFTIGAYNEADISGIEVVALGTSAPVISSATTASGQVGTAFTYQITASNSPTGFNATGLPSGLSVNTITGLISGTPTVAATSTVSLSAVNGTGTGSASLTLTIGSAANTAPTISSVANQTTTTGNAVGPLAFTVGDAETATTSLTVTKASSNTTLVPAANIVLGGSGAGRTVTVTPAASQTGTATITLTVSDGSLSTNTSFTLTVNSPAPGISSPTTANGQTGTAFSYQIVASGNPTSYDALGLPAGLSINTTTGLISGTPTTLGATTVTIKATNSGGTVSMTLTITILAPLPYTADFETAQGYSLASLNAQQGWTVSPGAASVTNSDHSNGAQSVSLAASNPAALVSQRFASTPTGTIEFFDFYAKPVAQATLGAANATFTVEGAKFALQVNGGQGLLRVYTGNGSGGGTWTSTAFSTALAAGNVTSNWIRFTARLDFTNQKWDLYANGSMVAADVPFTSASTYLSVFQMLGDVTTASRLDYIYAGPTNPLFSDSNSNGIDDTWETSHGLSLSSNNRNTSPTNNGVTVIQAYVAGTNPSDFFNSSTPTLIMLGGNNQTGTAGQFNELPLDMGVWNAAGTAAIVNAPVTFMVQSGGGKLALSKTGTTSSTIGLTTDTNGTAIVYFQQPTTPGTQSTILFTAGTAQAFFYTNAFVELNLGNLTNLTDSDNDGLPDAWEMIHFHNLTSATGAMDSDGDGISNAAEYRAGTNPTINENTGTLTAGFQLYFRIPTGQYSAVKSDWSIISVP